MITIINNRLKYPFRAILAAWLFAVPAVLVAQDDTSRLISIDNPVNKTRISIDLPASTKGNKKLLLVFYALPNGNSIEWTMGKRMAEGDDWHYDIQHIAAQTRWLRSHLKDKRLAVVYLSTYQKSWPAWKRERRDGPAEIRRIVDSISGLFSSDRPEIMLNSHSGGGSFIFGYLDAVPSIPATITRIGFIDSEYGYEDSLHSKKLADWLAQSKRHFLQVLAYNDSVVVYNGKPLVSPTGGTWYRSQLMQRNLSRQFDFAQNTDTAFIRYYALHKRITVLLKTNPEGKIYHTEQVARNGFIQTVVGGTKYERQNRYQYWGERIYTGEIR